MVIVLASFIVLGSVMMFVFSQYTKSDKRKLLMQNASSKLYLFKKSSYLFLTFLHASV